MLVKRFHEAKPYNAPNHSDCKALRLQGFEPGGPESCWVGVSHFLPGGGAGPDKSPLEKIYVVLSGEMTVMANGQEVVLKPMDSCTIAPDVERQIINGTNAVASMLVIMPYMEEQ